MFAKISEENRNFVKYFHKIRKFFIKTLKNKVFAKKNTRIDNKKKIIQSKLKIKKIFQNNFKENCNFENFYKK